MSTGKCDRSGCIKLPRSLLSGDARTLWVYANLIGIADEYGNVEIRTNSWCSEIGLSRQQLRETLNRLRATNYITNSSTNRGTNGKTNLIICNTDNNIESSPIIQPIEQPIKEPIAQPIITNKDSSATLNSSRARQVRFIPPVTVPFNSIVEQLKLDQPWRESAMRSIGLTEAELDKALVLYPDHCIAQGEPPKTIKEAKYHIMNWLRRRNHSTPINYYETNRQDRFSERRGTDPTANRAEDYSTTL